MSGNTIGRLFTSPPSARATGRRWAASSMAARRDCALTEADLQADVDRRRTGTSHFVSQRREADQVRILSGVFEGRTTGTPIGLLIENTDARSRDYDKLRGPLPSRTRRLHLPAEVRPARSSRRRPLLARARRSCAVAAGAIARKYLAERLGVRIYGYLSQVGDARRSRRSIRRPPIRTRSSVRIRRASPSSRQLIWEDARRRRFDRRAHHGGCRAACRRASASRCSTGWMRTSPTR